ncbi:YbaK/prolyl-tRNA synthetase associated domain-containing protein [Shewanella avicenniae]|uniref:YbaK/prolyl-tRNA synthetase associated domain-containing protein n=1 Tax=Shewanella avicenniae TaxID=2814294 RepID=A0ABX7QQG8_9GAMM|nr:YbaK/prolyl-tRNA synthetase associated domain-containing protein [Shewanella avicenniae]QSX33277.1 YbaK/prolyl-tRNA synthetase associated domain-containing protein [Shewanella avicenniae]
MLNSNVFQTIYQHLSEHNARFRVVEHPSAGRCEMVAQLRGTELGQGAKALLTHLKGNGVKRHVLAILPGDAQADLAKLASHFGARKASLASPAEMTELTGCVAGAIPPFSLHPALTLVAAPQLFSRYEEIAFNAGSLERSIILATDDYRRIAQPELVDFIRSSTD